MATISSRASWQVVLRQPSGKVVLYNPHSKQLSVQASCPDIYFVDEGSQAGSAGVGGDVEHRQLQLSSSSSRSFSSHHPGTHCPLCLQPLNMPPSTHASFRQGAFPVSRTMASGSGHQRRALPPPSYSTPEGHPAFSGDASSRTVTQRSYFSLLSRASSPLPSRAVTPPGQPPDFFSVSPPASSPPNSRRSSIDRVVAPSVIDSPQEPLGDEKRVDGYYERFFKEDMKLGRGQKGSVFLCTHVLDGNALGHYAVKKIAVGQSSPELFHVLKEVKCLESLRHKNITQYHHAWIENAQLSRFGPRVPVLYILMDYANGGSLDNYISLRKGGKAHSQCSSPLTTDHDNDVKRRLYEKKLFRKKRGVHLQAQRGTAFESFLNHSPVTWSNMNVVPRTLSPESQQPVDAAVHLFGFEEILNVFEDTCQGLGFLHSRGILHHDLKTENVLLHWDSEDAMIPTALISDFGSSVTQSENWLRERTGRTGTLDWAPPESLKIDPRTGKLYEVTQKGDMWQLGLVLHFLCFFRLPYSESDDIDRLRNEIIKYPGFLTRGSPHHSDHRWPLGEYQLSRTDLPHSMLKLMSNLLCLDPSTRPSCEAVLASITRIRQEEFSKGVEQSYPGFWRSRTRSTSNRSTSRGYRGATAQVASDRHRDTRSFTSALIKRKKRLNSPLLPSRHALGRDIQNETSQEVALAKVSGLNSRSLSSRHIPEPDSLVRRSRSISYSRSKSWRRTPRKGQSPMRSLPLPPAMSYIPRRPLPQLLVACFALQVALKTAAFSCIIGVSFSSPASMLLFTVLNSVELVVCDWKLTMIVTLLEVLSVGQLP